jgi:hypothetical protein
MSDRNPTKLRNEKGNHYCMNCQQPVFTKTPFNKLHLAVLITISSIFVAGIGLIGQVFVNLLGMVITALLFGIPIGSVTYVIYWYFFRKPVCPICNARHFEPLTERHQANTTQNRSTNEQQGPEEVQE